MRGKGCSWLSYRQAALTTMLGGVGGRGLTTMIAGREVVSLVIIVVIKDKGKREERCRLREQEGRGTLLVCRRHCRAALVMCGGERGVGGQRQRLRVGRLRRPCRGRVGMMGHRRCHSRR